MTRPTRGRPRATSRRARPAAKRVSPRALGSLTPPPPNWFLIHPWLQEAGIQVTAETATQVAAVYGCCRLIVDCLAPAPILVTEIQGDGAHEVLHDDGVAWTLNYGAPVAQAPDALTSQAIEESLYWAALLDGNGYAEIQRDNSGKFFGLWPVDSERVTPKRDEDGFYYEVSQHTGGVARVEPVDMFHLRGPSLKGWVGDSIIYRAAKAIGIAGAAQIYSSAYFANGTAVSGLLTSDKNVTPAQAKDAKSRWNEDHGGGPSKAHGVSVLGAGVKYQPINQTNQEAMLIEARRFQVQEIARFFGVPTTLLADNEAWTNLSELYLGFYRNALRPWAERFDAEASRKLMAQRKPWREVTHDLTHLTLGSFKDQVAALVAAVGGKPIWTQNEARAIFGKNSMDGCDTLDVPGPAAKDLAVEPAKPDHPNEKPMPDKGASPNEGDMANAAVVVMLGHELERYAKKLANRRADLSKSAPEKIEAGIEKARSQFRVSLIEDCADALLMLKHQAATRELVVAMADAVEQGEPPKLAAMRVLSTAMGTA